jgi:hypothetical protein
MRQTPQDLGGPLNIRSQGNLVDTFAPQGGGGLGALKPTGQVFKLDLTGLSKTYKKITDERAEWNAKAGEAVARKVGAYKAEGKTDDQIIQLIADSKDTPERTKALFAKQAAGPNGIQDVDLPEFQLGLDRFRGDVVAAGVEASAEAFVNESAAKIAGLEAGADDSSIIGEMLAGISEANQESIDGLGIVGREAAAPQLERTALNAAAEARRIAKELRRAERDHIVQGNIVRQGEAFVTASTDEGKDASIAAFSSYVVEMRKQGEGKWKEKGADYAVLSAGSIARNHGLEDGIKFLQAIEVDAQSSTGELLYAEGSSETLGNAIDQMTTALKREKDQYSARESTKHSDASYQVGNSDVGKVFIEASLGTDARAPGALYDQYLARLRDPLQQAQVLEEMGLTGEDAGRAERLLLEQRIETEDRQRNTDKGKDKVFRDAVLQEYVTGGLQAAMQLAKTHDGFTPEGYLNMQKEVRKWEQENFLDVWQRAETSPIYHEMNSFSRTLLPMDDEGNPHPLSEDIRAETVAQYKSAISELGFGPDKPYDSGVVHETGLRIMAGVKERYAAIAPEIAQDLKAKAAAKGDPFTRVLTETTEAKAVAEAITVRAGLSKRVIGGFDRAKAPPGALKTEAFLRGKPKEMQAPKNRQTALGVFKYVGHNPEIPAEQRSQVMIETAARMGYVSLASLESGDVEAIKADIIAGFRASAKEEARIVLSRPGSSGRFRANYVPPSEATLEGRADLAEMPDLQHLTEMDLEGINTNLYAHPDLKDANTYLTFRAGSTDDVILDPAKPLPDDLEESILKSLLRQGREASENGIIDFLTNQSLQHELEIN